MDHERELLEEVTRARSNWMNASTVQENAGADDMASKALKSIFAVAENYPDLKANENFLMLQEELVGIENKIAYARQRYNRTVLDLNNSVQQFPTNVIAQAFQFQTREFFEVESDKVREVPQVDF
jgi:LemA protein